MATNSNYQIHVGIKIGSKTAGSSFFLFTHVRSAYYIMLSDCFVMEWKLDLNYFLVGLFDDFNKILITFTAASDNVYFFYKIVYNHVRHW